VSKKVPPLRLLHIFPPAAVHCMSKLICLFAIDILTYVPIMVHLSQYLRELQRFCPINPLIFTARRLAKRGICRRRVSVCLCVCACVCVCVSVTLRYCIKTAKRRITQITPHDSALPLVF